MVTNIGYHKPKQIQIREIERLKLENFVIDESGKRPVVISVVMPTFNKHDKEYNRTVLEMINILGNLIDNGVIDEVVIAEGSRIDGNRPDTEFMEFLLAAAVKYCRTFDREVEFVRLMPEGKQKALQGRYDFSFRILNQLDPELHKIYLEHGILSKDELEFLKSGKGANLWFSVPVTYGDIVCFIDSDIVSFKKHYVKGLCRPILQGWNSESIDKDKSSIIFTKATYIRQHKVPYGFKIGGRLSRLFGIPMLNLLAEKGIFNGLESITYPFSGECALTRRALGELQFSNGYDIELSILCQLWKKYGMERIAQYDFGFFRHIPGDDKHIEEMLLEISMALFYWIRRYGLEDRIGDIDRLLDEYEKMAVDMLAIYEDIAKENPSRIRYNPEDRREDMERISRYKRIVREGYERSKFQKPKLLKPWADIRRQMDAKVGYSYQNLKTSLQTRVNRFTSETILSYVRIYVDRSMQIINKFIE